MITGLYAAIFAVFLILLKFRVIKRRQFHKISLGHGDNVELEKHIRAHGNFIETVPFILFLMMIVELGAVQGWIIHALGLSLLVGRVMHVYALTSEMSHVNFRVFGMAITISVMAVAAILSLF